MEFQTSPSSGETSPLTPAGTPVSSAAPKYGTLIPNRIFVGGIASNTSEIELKQFFAAYGTVKDCKIIMDRAGVSKGYGFVTFETQEDADKIIKKESDNLIFRDRKLNIGPAIRKQQAFPSRLYEPSLSPSAVLYTNGVPYTYQNGMAVFSSDSYALQTQPQATYPVMVSPPQYAIQPSYYQASPIAASTATAAQWRWAPTSPTTQMTSAAQYMYQPMQHAAGETLIYPQHPGTAQTAAAAYHSTADMAAAEASLIEAGSAAEGSFSTNTNTRPALADGTTPPSHYAEPHNPMMCAGGSEMNHSTVAQHVTSAPHLVRTVPSASHQRQPTPHTVHSTTFFTPKKQHSVCYGPVRGQRYHLPTPPPTPCYTPVHGANCGPVPKMQQQFGDTPEHHKVEMQDMTNQGAPLTPPGTPRMNEAVMYPTL